MSQNSVELFNLGERNQGAYQKNDKRKKFLLRKMDASRRAMNPGRFNKDGTYKKGTHGKWKVSKSNRKRLYEYQELCRKEAATRLYANREARGCMNIRSSAERKPQPDCMPTGKLPIICFR